MNSPSSINYRVRENPNNRSKVNNKTQVIPSDIYEELSINPGEVKIILEACLDYSTAYKLPNGNSCSTVDYSKILEFYVVRPKYTYRIANERTCFNSVVIFTPKPGLFSETASL